jgi:hypothetical protein
MVEVSRLGAVRSMIFCCNVRESSDRIARIPLDTQICRTFLRSVLLWVIDRHGMYSDRSRKYRQLIGRTEM